MANKASYRVGRYLSPQPDDPALATLADAHREAAQQAAECDKTAIAVWGEDDETLALYLNGESFIRD